MHHIDTTLTPADLRTLRKVAAHMAERGQGKSFVGGLACRTTAAICTLLADNIEQYERVQPGDVVTSGGAPG